MFLLYKKSYFVRKCLLILLTIQFAFIQSINNRALSIEKNNLIEDINSRGFDENNKLNFKENKYILGPGDLLKLKFIYMNEYSSEILVLNDGTVDIPFVGEVYLQGLTLKLAEKKIKNELKKEVLNPLFDLKIIKQRPMVVSVLGEVEIPGLYTLNVENQITKNDENLTYKQLSQPKLIDAIEAAGGIKPTADLKNIQLRRLMPGNNNQFKSKNINLHKMFINGSQIENPTLFDSDIIFVYKAKKIEENNINYAINSFNAKTIKITVIGEVENPGLIEIKNGSNLTQAILNAGSTLGWKSNKNKIELIRMRENGSLSIKEFSYSTKKGFSKNSNIKLLSGDVIRVKTSKLGLLSDTIISLTNPLSGILSAIAIYKIAD